MTGPRIPASGSGAPGHDAVWVLHARCRDTPTGVFFPVRRLGDVSSGADAKAICARCPVVADCLADVIGYPLKQKSGIWGGCAIDGPVGRRLRALARVAPHGPLARPGCSCPFCVAVAAHRVELRRAFGRDGRVWHGRWEAFVHAGCRCRRCSTAHGTHERSADGRWLPSEPDLGDGGDAA